MNYEGFMAELAELKGLDWYLEEGGEIRCDDGTSCGVCPTSALANDYHGTDYLYNTFDWELAGKALGMHELTAKAIALAADDDADADISTRADLLEALGLMERPI